MGSTNRIRYGQYHGTEFKEHINILAQFRLEQFKEYPYLYVGDYEQEQTHIESYAKYQESSLIIVSDVDRIVAVSTSLPLKYEAEIVSCCMEELINKGLDASKGYYFGETIILPEYRSQGIGTTIVNMQEQYARLLGCEFVSFMAVRREADHPLKPKDYIEAAVVFDKMRFEKTNVVINISWTTLQHDGSVMDQLNTLDFWIKRI